MDSNELYERALAAEIAYGEARELGYDDAETVYAYTAAKALADLGRVAGWPRVEDAVAHAAGVVAAIRAEVDAELAA